MFINRNNKEDLLKELEQRTSRILIENIFKYRRNNVIIKTEKIETQLNINTKLTLCDGSEILALIL